MESPTPASVSSAHASASTATEPAAAPLVLAPASAPPPSDPVSVPSRPAPSDRLYEPDDLGATLDVAAIFGLTAEEAAARPLEVEIGCGNGRYLRRGAGDRPDHLFVGLERAVGFARKARDRMVKYCVGNVRVVCADATHLLATHFAPESIHALHVYFTDPWPKKRHGKRRIFQTPFLETLTRVLRPGAPVFIKVDLFWYFEEILGRFEQSPQFAVTACGAESDRERDLFELTGFEQKALRHKGQIFYLVARRKTSSVSWDDSLHSSGGRPRPAR